MISVAYASDIGKVRQTNQDYVEVFENKKHLKLAIVADGMGGHQAGDVASSMAVQNLGHAFLETDFATQDLGRKWLEVNLTAENEKILAASDRFNDLHGMGTTIVLALLFDQSVLLAHLGDSRAYLLRNHKLEQLTEDHSLVNELLKAGQITEDEAKNHPQKNIVTETLGVSTKIKPEFNQLTIEDRDLIFLCTDGLTNHVATEDIQAILNESTPLQERADKLIATANENGGNDNITVCLIQYQEVGE